ncbi:MAG TPA: hypothetical protein DEV81_00790 [Cyanobacteria bacterium UBA11049]|nr:hypothetical protein [Cyanobacteria bacterium UBA11049]
MMGLDSPDPTRTPVSTAYHFRERGQSFALAGGASVAVGLGLAVDYTNTFLRMPKTKAPFRIAYKLPDFRPAYQTTCANHAFFCI